MVRSGRWIQIAAIVAAAVAGLHIGFSRLVASLPVSTSILTSVNAGLLAACIDIYRRQPGARSSAREPSKRTFEIAVVAVVQASALLGTQSFLGENAEQFLGTALLVMTTGYVGFFFGMLAREQAREAAPENTERPEGESA